MYSNSDVCCCTFKTAKMDLVSWSLSTLDKIFGTRSEAPGEPPCPAGTFHAGYARDAWNNWKVICLEQLSIEDIEDIYLFGLIIVGFSLFGSVFALLFFKLRRLAAIKDIVQLSEDQKDFKGTVEQWCQDFHRKTTQHEAHFRNIVARDEDLLRRTDAVMGQCAEILRRTQPVMAKLDEILKELTALGQELKLQIH